MQEVLYMFEYQRQLYNAINTNDILQATLAIHNLRKNGHTYGLEIAMWPACKRGRALIVELLLDAGADINTKDREGTTYLMYACILGNVSIAELLIEKKRCYKPSRWWWQNSPHTCLLR